MSEVRTAPVKAQHVDKATFRREGIGEAPGAFYVGEPHEDGTQAFWYACPCGCGAGGMILVGNGFKPQSERASWNWNGSLDAPTLSPSVHHVGHWHGWLRNGVWESC